MRETYSKFGSCVLKTPAIECRPIPAIDTSIDTRSTLGRHSVATRSPLGRHIGRHPVDSRSTRHRVSIDTSGDHTFDVGRRIDRYLMVGCRYHVGRLSVIYIGGMSVMCSLQYQSSNGGILSNTPSANVRSTNQRILVNYIADLLREQNKRESGI